MRSQMRHSIPLREPFRTVLADEFSWSSYWKSRIKSLFSNNLIGHWLLDEKTGAIAIDYSVENNNAAYIGVVQLNQKILSNWYGSNFKGTGALNIYSAALASDINMDEGALGVFVKTNAENTWLTATKYLFILSSDGSSNRVFCSTVGTNLLVSYYIGGGTNKNITIDTPYGDRPFHLMWRWSKISNKFDIFINGVLAGSVASLGSFTGAIGASYATIMSYSAVDNGLAAIGSNAILLKSAPSDAQILSLVSPKGIALFEGDSRMNQKGWTGIALNYSRSDLSFGFSKLGYANYAVSGKTVASLIANAAVVNARILTGKTNTIIIWIGVNSSTSSAADLFAAIKGYCVAAKTAGWNKVILCTEIDAQDATRLTNDWPNKYLALNTLIRNDPSFYDGLADLGARTELQDATNTTYYNADKLHLATAGYNIVAQVVGATIATLV